MTKIEKRIPHEIHPFKGWPEAGTYLHYKPRSTTHDSDEKSFSPPGRSVKGRLNGEWWWFTPSGVPFARVEDKTAWTIAEQRADLAYREQSAQDIADEGMKGHSAEAGCDQSEDGGDVDTNRYHVHIQSISMDDYDLFYGD